MMSLNGTMAAKSQVGFFRRAAASISLIRATLLFVCATAGLYLAFKPALKDGMLASNADPLFFYVSFNGSQRFGSSLDLQTFAFGQGFGGFQHPTLLHPYWWIFDYSHSIVVTYYFAIVVLFIGTLTQYRALGRDLFLGIVAATTACTLFFNSHYLADFFGAVAAQHVAQIGIAYLGLAIIAMSCSRSFAGMLLGFLLLVWSILMDWLYAAFLVPFIGINLIAFAVYLKGVRLALFCGAAAVWVGLLYMAGVYQAYDGFTLMSDRLWGASTWGGEGPWSVLPTSLLILGGWIGLPFAKTFGIMAAIGVLCRIVVWRRHLSVLALLVVLYLGVLAFFDLNAAGPHVYWTLPTLGYFERPLIPLYVIFLISSLADIAPMVGSFLRPRLGGLLAGVHGAEKLANGWKTGVLGLRATAPICLAIPAAFVLVIGMPGSKSWHYQVNRQPVRWDLAMDFVNGLRLPSPEGPQFSPYFFDATANGKVFNCTQLGDPALFGRYCAGMLDIHSTRMFQELHNLVDIQSLQMHAHAYTLARSVADPGRRQSSFGALRSLGIRYLAIDGSVEPARELVLGGESVSLIDLGPIEPVDLSAKSIKYDSQYNAQEVLAARREGIAVVHSQAAVDDLRDLRPVENFKFEYGPDRFTVSVDSSGNSLLLLPFQFSNCLSVRGNGDAQLIRINGAQAALHFTGHTDIEVVNNFRLFGDISCRQRDFADVFKIGLWPRQTYEQITDGRRVPILMRVVLQKRIRQRDAISVAQNER